MSRNDTYPQDDQPGSQAQYLGRQRRNVKAPVQIHAIEVSHLNSSQQSTHTECFPCHLFTFAAFARLSSIRASIWSPLSYLRPQSSDQLQIVTRSQNENPVSCPPDDYSEQYDTTKRVQLGKGTVRGFPSTGGILLLSLDITVAIFLNLPRLFDAERAADPEEEDKFCNQLRLLGASWWKDEQTKARTMIGIEGYDLAPEQRQARIVGWPTDQSPEYGGVWILRAATPRDLPQGCHNMLRMCVNMDERCDLLKRWNATFYKDPAALPEFEEVLGGGTKGSSSAGDEEVSERSDL